jgi:hypothetical protein
MFYAEFLQAVHQRLRPRTYLEIGVGNGRSLALSRARSVGVDPTFAIDVELDGDVALVRTTIDEYFARPDPLALTGGRRFDLVFIDGLHLFEVVLRNFCHAERMSTPWSVIIVNGVLPRKQSQARRSPVSPDWTGDVYKLTGVLRKRRPSLTVLAVDTRPAGLLVVLGLDPSDTTLADEYVEIVKSEVPATGIPREVLTRETALAPQRVLAAPVLDLLHSLRQRSATPEGGAGELADALARSFGPGELISLG